MTHKIEGNSLIIGFDPDSKEKMMDVLSIIRRVKMYIPSSELSAIIDGMRSEEKQYQEIRMQPSLSHRPGRDQLLAFAGGGLNGRRNRYSPCPA